MIGFFLKRAQESYLKRRTGLLATSSACDPSRTIPSDAREKSVRLSRHICLKWKSSASPKPKFISLTVNS